MQQRLQHLDAEIWLSILRNVGPTGSHACLPLR